MNIANDTLIIPARVVEENNNLIKLFIKAIIYLLIAFGVVLLQSYGALILLILCFLYFFSDKYGQEAIILITVIFTTYVLEFFNVNSLPYIQLGAGLRFNGLDLLIVPIAVKSYMALKKEKINTKSAWFIEFYILLAIVYVIISFFITISIQASGFNFLRVLFYPAFYFALVKLFLNKRKLYDFLIILSFICAIATVIQIYELTLSYRLEIPGFKPNNIAFYQEGLKVFTGGRDKLYLWSRVTGLLFVTLIFSSIFVFNNVKYSKFFIFIMIISMIGFIIAIVRVWLVSIFIALILSIIFSEKKGNITIKVFGLIFVIGIVIYQLTTVTHNPGEIDLLTSLIGRVGSIFNPLTQYGEQNTAIVRIILNTININKFFESPLWGHGFGQSIILNYYNLDVGISNRLVLFGLLGTLPLLYFLITYSVKNLRELKLYRNLHKNDKSLLIGSNIILLSILPAYFWQLDFFGGQLFIIPILALAISDNILLKNKLS